ncbi:MAG: ABC transporter substrate-binding protein [Pirellulaceae bacterium]|nr:ABC transporter substrate-binding protein [Pirellulaceae bacterium]
MRKFHRCYQLLTVLSLTFLASLTGCGSTESSKATSRDGQTLDSVVLMLNWYPEVEHGGFYAAKVHGIFEQFGLDVEIRPGGPSSPVAQELLTGRAQFAIGNADDVLLFREQQADIVALLAPVQNTPRCILVHAESAAKDLSSLAGMTLQANVGRPFVDYMQHLGLLRDVKVVPYSGSIANFIADKNTAIQAYSFSEPLLAAQQGVNSRSMMLSDVGFNPYASCLLATRQSITQNADLVRRMVHACQQGWQKYLQQPEQTNALILQLNTHAMTAQALEEGVKALRPLCLPQDTDAGTIGQMSLQRWRTLAEQFVELGLSTTERAAPEKAFTTEFLRSDVGEL